ncbi:unnamed protein product [Rhizophagus irregularis]|uniref:Uncharacterized protein n=2 Tax=Rhizophagus irregularis TaxID=588596 RepID=A0A915Z691_9GLOM|nr:unnamed protein product [Rhizophagus irregularis]
MNATAWRHSLITMREIDHTSSFAVCGMIDDVSAGGGGAGSGGGAPSAGGPTALPLALGSSPLGASLPLGALPLGALGAFPSPPGSRWWCSSCWWYWVLLVPY